VDNISDFEHRAHIDAFEKELFEKLNEFNKENFPSPEFKRQVYKGSIDEEQYSHTKNSEFLKEYDYLIKKYNIKLKQYENGSFLDKWYIDNVRKEIDRIFNKIKVVKDKRTKKILAIILSRTIRSCRATTHYDLATLKEPQFTTYYCHKHKKICKPIFSIKKMFNRYSFDTLKRLREFCVSRTDAQYSVIAGDSRCININRSIKKHEFKELLKKKRIDGIFTSPPYVGQIDYHEQHAYAYELFGYERKDELEIGPLYKGQGYEARKSYVDGIVEVLKNCQKYMKKNCHMFIVANDKYNLYPIIAEKAGLEILQRFKRPVLNRSERDKGAYAEIIFYCGAKVE
jgi:DNA modification methylase